MTRLILLCATVLGLLSGPAFAAPQTFAMTLGKRHIGTLVIDATGRDASLSSRLDNTPLGVADGTFKAVSRIRGETLDYRSESRGSKVRDIAVTRLAGSVTAVTVTPEDDATDLSDVTRVPPDVLSPPEVFAALVNGGTCPSPMTMYDGRRVIQIETAGATRDGETELCEMSYRVILGPGHLSPFRFRSIGLELAYLEGALMRITLSAGGFNLNLTRS